jgi:hypothetical protein
MLKSIRVLIISIVISGFMFADVFMTELTDPQNSTDAGRYVELYNNGDSDIDLSLGWKIQRWTNGNPDPTASSIKDLTGTISAGGFYIICNDADKYNATYGLTCDQDIGTAGAADSNGDDNIAILDVSGVIHDMFGVAGEDGTGTGHEFEDGRAERAAGVTAANATWDETEWNIDNDSGGGDGNQYAPEGFDPGAWIGEGPPPDTCEDESACNTGADGACEYPDTGYDCDGNCVGDIDCLGVCGGDATTDCNGACDGSAVVDACGICGGDDSSCSVSVTFSVDMSLEGVVGDIKVRTSTVNGEYSPSDWYVMSDNSDGSYSHTLSLLTGVTYGYNFNNSDGSGYESGSGLGDCAGGTYGNDRFVTPDEADTVLDTVCWESCDACPAVIEGCTDDTATNYDPDATVDDGTCEYDTFEAANLFISEAAEGSSNHKYIEVYNASSETVDLVDYAFANTANAPSTPGEYEYWTPFDGLDQSDANPVSGSTLLAPGDVYVVCDNDLDASVIGECDQYHAYLSNGDDGFCLVAGSEGNFEVLDCVGDWYGNGEGGYAPWDVAGVSDGTKNHTIVRKADVTIGNGGQWEPSAGSDADDSEWVVLDSNDWTYIGSHPHDFSVATCDDESACNTGAEGDCTYADTNYDCDGDCTADVDCDGICAGDAAADNCGTCDSDAGNDCTQDCAGTWGGSAVEDECGTCDDDASNDCVPCTYDGDVNGDGNTNVTDIVLIVGAILNDTGEDIICTADMNGDGLINVVDVVALVNQIVGGGALGSNGATEAIIEIASDQLSVRGMDGTVDGVQLTLSHGSNFSIELVNVNQADMEFAAKRSINNTTTMVIVAKKDLSFIGTTTGEYDIISYVVAATDEDGSGIELSTSSTSIIEVVDFKLAAAYPNPFNPTTTLELAIPERGYVSVKVYNLVGQEVATLVDGVMDANPSYTFQWNAGSLSSGVYLVRAEGAGQVTTQKLMLLK